MFLQLAALTALGLGGMYLAAGRDLNRMHPGEKRTHLFEDDDGERKNPFGDLDDGAESDDTRLDREIRRLKEQD